MGLNSHKLKKLFDTRWSRRGVNGVVVVLGVMIEMSVEELKRTK
jgi:hypothetical protein